MSAPGLRSTGVPVLGVLPFIFGLPVDEEDAVGLGGFRGPVASPPLPNAGSHESGQERAWQVSFGVIRLPHISNATDFQPLMQTPDVRVYYVDSPDTFGTPDVVILPGTKSEANRPPRSISPTRRTGASASSATAILSI